MHQNCSYNRFGQLNVCLPANFAIVPNSSQPAKPILCYTDTVWGELSATSSKTLQRLQNRAARIVLRRDSSKDTLNVLGWVELETKQKRHKCALVYKCLNNLVPKYLSGYFTRNFNVHNYNTRRRTDLHLPKPKLSLAYELLDIFLTSYPITFKTPSHFLLSEF